MERRPSTITAPAMAPMAPAVTPSTNAATAGCLPWRRNPWGTEMRSCSSSVLVQETAEQVASVDPG
jgi:hypothetical protein